MGQWKLLLVELTKLVMFLHLKETDVLVETACVYQRKSSNWTVEREEEKGNTRETEVYTVYFWWWSNIVCLTNYGSLERKLCCLENVCCSFFINAVFFVNMYNINVGQKLCCLGVSQSSKSSCNGGPSYCQASDGYSDSSCACSNGGWTSDADSLDTKNHCGRGSHSSTASTYFALDSTTFQGTCTSYSGSHCISAIKEVNYSLIRK